VTRKALGKGIHALIPDFEIGPDPAKAQDGLRELLIDEIIPNSYQPRKIFNEEALQDLADSIRENGIIQPIVVQKKDDRYELICGERRWRSAQQAGLKKIPAIVREASSREALQIALIENIHREDLNPIEEAHAYQRMLDDFSLTQEDIAQRVGKKRATVANYLRLLKLSRPIQEALISGELTMGHARALLALETPQDMETVRREVAKKSMSVRQVEFFIQKLKRRGPKRHPKNIAQKDIHTKNMETALQRHLGTKVEIEPAVKGGKLVIHYYSNDDLSRIHDMILRKE